MELDHIMLEKYRGEQPFHSMQMLVYEVIKDAIIECRIPPGYSLKEVPVSQALEVSRTTVRSAFDGLLQEGLIERIGSRLYVTHLDNAEFRYNMEARIALEPFVARLATQRCTKKDLQVIAGFIPPTPWKEALVLQMDNQNFHRSIFEATHNPTLCEMFELSRCRNRRYFYSVAEDFFAYSKEIHQEHKEIYEAIASGDENKAYKLSKQHIRFMLEIDVEE